ncbi:hypothetical protein P170DRAFT_421273 [Aspergillus steynii IBT 23096]|uniref:Histone h1.3 n=1 Tax=Aspergillus steynii IBT 23096 TaxID=1392250 RepID=A0A2I2GNY6_9EURO|nr:uncharacterized protein P170DRAFT_421273 [Aspergillus steynii IBT 23096]PLB54587.1 hypothetical protein P170DRAFT_421273 [Aspergillus steynii IBT 23096]
MSAAAKLKPDGLLGLSMAEARALLVGIACEEGGKVDMEKLASKYPYKNSASASTSYRNAKRKLVEYANTLGDGAASASSAASPGGATISTSATSTPKKRTPAQRKKATSTDSDVAADDATGSPKPKRQRKTPVKKSTDTDAKVKKPVEDDDDAAIDGLLNPEYLNDDNQTVNVKMEESYVPMKHDEEELGSIDLDAELDAMETPKSVKPEDVEA